MKEVMGKFGAERVQFILANTIRHKDSDGRISQDNKAWAKTIPMPEDSGASRHCAYPLAFHKQMTDITIGSSSSLSDFAISQKDVEFIDKINAILLEQVVNENYSIETLADQMNMSHSNLYRKMKSLFGMPPNNYVKNFRLNKAAELIANGVRIAEAAERLGFASSSHFAKCFKEKFGMLPKDYR